MSARRPRLGGLVSRMFGGDSPSTRARAVRPGRDAHVAAPRNVDERLRQARDAWLEQMQGLTDQFGRVRLPPARMLTERQLEHCLVLPDREAILRRGPAGGTAVEVGVQTGDFSRSILDICRPSKLHLIDIDLHSFSVGQRFEAEIDAGRVVLHEGDSSSLLRQFPDGTFDFVYVDADHSYPGVKRDIEAAKSKVKADGYLIFNDYTYRSPAESVRYGVIQAVNELCLDEDWVMVYFALEYFMYCDVAIRRR